MKYARLCLFGLSFVLLVLSGLLLLSGTFLTGVDARAAAIVVTSRTDSGSGSLRQALLSAVPGDTISFDPAVFPPTTPMTITLLKALPAPILVSSPYFPISCTRANTPILNENGNADCADFIRVNPSHPCQSVSLFSEQFSMRRVRCGG